MMEFAVMKCGEFLPLMFCLPAPCPGLYFWMSSSNLLFIRSMEGRYHSRLKAVARSPFVALFHLLLSSFRCFVQNADTGV